MLFRPTEIPDVILVELEVHRDARGFFLETYHARKYAKGGILKPFVQDNHSRSTRGILRGLHLQRTRPQGKLMRVIEGEIWDVVVDVRRGSPTFARWVGTELSDRNHHQLYVPPGFLHGFCVISEVAQVQYKCTDFYFPEDELAVLWNDPEIGIDWPITDPILSEKDRKARRLADVTESLPIFPQERG